VGQLVDLAGHRARRGAPEPWCRKADVARHFSVSVRTVERWQQAGMPYRKVSRSLALFRISEAEQWAAGRL
jgi:phage terminase Nu1 subunit (DNA packaging protein)